MCRCEHFTSSDVLCLIETRQLLTKEYYALQTSMEKRVSELETVVTEKSVKLDTYEKLEHELDQVIMQAAEGELTIYWVFIVQST